MDLSLPELTSPDLSLPLDHLSITREDTIVVLAERCAGITQV